jgi:hypothetical protein
MMDNSSHEEHKVRLKHAVQMIIPLLDLHEVLDLEQKSGKQQNNATERLVEEGKDHEQNPKATNNL